MLSSMRGLSTADLSALADLERRVVAADGGRLKLEWPTLRAGGGEQFLWRGGDRLVGFLGRYSFGGGPPELVGAVAPEARRQGIGTALLDAALRAASARPLLVTTPAGRPFALARGAVPAHSEHALVLRSAPADGPADRRLVLRPATSTDAAAVRALLSTGFGWAGEPATDGDTLVGELDGRPVVTLRTSRDGAEGAVYGFAVAPAVRGRGIGRDALRRACQGLRAGGAERVGLEVAVDNESALGLYTSLGFVPVATEDYWTLPD